MNRPVLISIALATALLSSCYYDPNQAYGSGYQQPYPRQSYQQPYQPPRHGYHQQPNYQGPYGGANPQNYPTDAGAQASSRGYYLGVSDAQRGYQADISRYSNLYVKKTMKDFGRGYMMGYGSVR